MTELNSNVMAIESINTKVLTVDPVKPQKDRIMEAVYILKSGGIVAFPTETVYGLGAMYNKPEAVDRLYEVKNRPKDKPFTALISRIEMIGMMGCVITPLAKLLMDRFWPGPLTIILNIKDSPKTMAFRIPRNAIAMLLINEVGAPLFTPSANTSGGELPRHIGDVLIDLGGKIDMALDGGACKLGIESTIIDTTTLPYRILREGAIPMSSIKDAWHVEY